VSNVKKLGGGLLLKNDFEIIEHKFPREQKQLKVYVMADLHKGSQHFDEKSWLEFKHKLMTEPDSYAVLNGDLLDVATKTSKTNVYNQAMSVNEQQCWLEGELADIKHKVLCIINGNHEERVRKDSDYHILFNAAKVAGIGHLYRENIAFLSIHLGEGKNNKQIYYSGLATHGNSKTADSKFCTYFDGVDFYIYSHVHNVSSERKFKGVCDPYNKRITFRPYVQLVSSAFLDYAGYAVRKQYQPALYSENYIRLDGNRKNMEVTI